MRSAARSASWWGILLTPLLVLAALWSVRPLSHDDLFWHMRTGEIVLREGIVPTTDPFSYTRAGQPWVSHEWGFGVLLFGIHGIAGFEGLVAFQVILTLAIFSSLGVLLAQTRPRAPGSAILIPVVLGMALWAGSHELKLNAAPVTTLFLIWELLLLHAFRRTRRRVHLLALALLFLVWSNVHSGVLFGLMLLGFWWVEASAPAVLARFPSGFARPVGHATSGARLALLFGALIICLLNPNGIETLLYPVRLSFFLFTTNLPLYMGHFTAPTPADRSGFFFLVGLLLAGLLPFRRIRRLSASEILTIGMFLILSLRSNRFILDFAVLASPAVLKLHGRILSIRAASMLVPVGTAVAFALSIVVAYRSLESRIVADEFPQRAAQFLEEERIDGSILNHQNFGGYLGWRLRKPVFWDGRNDVFGALMKDLVGKSLREIVDRYGVDILLFTELQYQPLKQQLRKEEWGLVYWDDYAAVFVRRVPHFQDVLERNEYRRFPPFGPPPDLAALSADPEGLRETRAELDRVLAWNPQSQRALYYQGLISLYTGELGRAWKELEQAARIRPNEVVDRALVDVLGLLLPHHEQAEATERVS